MSDVEPVRRLGAHLPLGGGLLRAADRASAIGANVMQIFTDNPTAWRRRADLPAAVDDFRRRLAELDIGPLAVHGPYLVNLCGADADFWARSVETMANELRVGRAYGARFVNVHTGSHRGHGRERGLGQLAMGLARVLDQAGADDTPILVLENSAGSGDGMGASIEELAAIAESVERAGVAPGRYGFCLDTAHLWAAGVPLDEPNGAARLVEDIDRLLGRERVVMVHLNDAATVRGSGVDRHQHIGAGRIGAAALREFLLEPWLAGLPTYLETPGMDSGYDAINLARVRLILRGEALPELPPEAFKLRGSRARTAPAEA